MDGLPAGLQWLFCTFRLLILCLSMRERERERPHGHSYPLAPLWNMRVHLPCPANVWLHTSSHTAVRFEPGARGAIQQPIPPKKQAPFRRCHESWLLLGWWPSLLVHMRNLSNAYDILPGGRLGATTLSLPTCPITPPLRFEKQKREQELQAAKHLDLGSDGEGSSSESDSETDDEDAEMLTPALDLQVGKPKTHKCCSGATYLLL